jgi:DNA-directed RNA polymerase specialized sigma24 family protein
MQTFIFFAAGVLEFMPKSLTSESLKKLLEAFSADETEASRLYTKLCAALVRFFHLKGVTDADKSADDTIDRVADKINQGAKVEDLRKFAFGVARFVYLENLRREEAATRAASEFYLKDSATAEFEESDHLETFRECFKNLYDHERKLLLDYFQDLPPDELFKNRQKLAERERIELNALRNKVSRLRKRLEECLGKKK